MDPQTLHGEKLGTVAGLQSQWWGRGSRRIPGACCLSCGPVGELQDDEENLSQENNQRRHLRITSRRSGGHFCGWAGVRDNPSLPVGEDVGWAGGEYRLESTKAWAKCIQGGWTTHDATTSGCWMGLPSHDAFRLQQAYQSHSPG